MIRIRQFWKLFKLFFLFCPSYEYNEGGMVSTNDKNIYEFSRIIRSHGMNREHDNLNLKKKKHQNFQI